MGNESQLQPDSSPEQPLAGSIFAAHLRDDVLQGAQKLMGRVSNGLPGSGVEDSAERVRFLGPLIKEVAQRIMSAIQLSQANNEDAGTLKRSIVAAGKLGDRVALFHGHTFTKMSREEIHNLAGDESYWRYRVSMAIRAEILAVDGQNSVIAIFKNLIADPETKELFKDEKGYKLAAHLYTKGSMLLAHTQMSRILKSQGDNLKTQLNWLAVTGSTRDYGRVVEMIKSDFDALRGIEGYIKFADKYTSGRMQKAYQLVSTACKYHDLDFKTLGWAQFLGTTDDFENITQQIATDIFKPAEIIDSMSGIDGYKNFALRHFEGDMLRAYQVVSAACKFKELPFDSLGWSQFHGKVEDFELLSSILRDKFNEFKGIEGYKKFSHDYAEGSMQRGFILVSAICKLSGLPFQELNWSLFVGSIGEFEKLGAQIKISLQKVIEPNSFAPFTQEFAASIQRQLKQVATQMLVDPALRAEVEKWAIFWKLANRFEERLKDFDWNQLRENKISDELLGVKGQKDFALRYTDGYMQKAFSIISAFCALEKINFESLGWVAFAGTVKQFDCIQEGIARLREEGKLSGILRLDKSDRLPTLIRQVSNLSPKFNKALKNIEPANFYSAIPEKLTEQVSRQDFSVAYLRLDIDGESIYFDSGAERICGFLLHKYGLIEKFIEGENLHVRSNKVNKISLDFYLKDKDLFIEYHPLSIGELYDGITLEQAGQRKIDSVQGGHYSHCRVIHIYDFDGLYDVLVKDLGIKLSRADFESSLAEARSYGYKCDRIEDEA